MGIKEKTVFISNRRTNFPWALAIFQSLTHSGYDVFYDFMSINSRHFEQIITENIKARAHFILLLTPSAIKRCIEKNDWLRREIEIALDFKRNIIPIFLENFDFGSPETDAFLTGKLETIKDYNGMAIYAEYFEAGMDKLRNRFLDIELDQVRHPIIYPVSPKIQEEVNNQKRILEEKAPVEEQALSAQAWFELAYKSTTNKEIIRLNTKAIELDPDFPYAYNNRGSAYNEQKQYQQAIGDFDRAIELNPEDADAYNNRGNSYNGLMQYQQAIQDYDRAIELDPEYADVYNNRGNSYLNLKQYQQAIQDYDRAIELAPKHIFAYNNRGHTYNELEQYQQAIQDYDRSIELNPEDAFTYINRGISFTYLKQYDKALEDFDRSIEINPEDGAPFYNKACLYAIQGGVKESIVNLRQALEFDLQLFCELASSDNDFDKIRHEREFQDLLKEFCDFSG